jgi:hypothetical protein
MKNLIHLGIIIGLISCNKGVEKSDNYPAIEIKDTVAINFGEFPLPNERSSFGNIDDNYSYSFAFSDSIVVFSLDLESNSWKLSSIPLEGSSGLKKNGDFIFINDSLGLYSLKGTNNFDIINFKAKTITTYKLEDFKLNIEGRNPGCIYYNKKLIGFPVSYYQSNKEKNYTKDVPIYVFYDLEMNKVRNYIHFPAEFHDKTFSLNHLGREFLVAGEKIYLNLSKSHNIYVYNTKGELINQQEISSKKVLDSESGFSENQMKNLIQFTYEGYYSSLLFDGINFYRTASYLSSKDNLNSNKPEGFLMDLETLNLEIIKFDSSLNVISRGDFSGSPSKKGIGVGNYFIFKGKPYYWLLDKDKESQERFVSVY